MLEGYFETINFSKQVCNVQMGTGLLPGLVDKLAILPVDLMAE
jgi:hypothetical protein